KHAEGNPTRLVFSAENGLLGDHPIVRGRNRAEQVRRVVAFTGQSLTVPAHATALLKISSDATESFDPEDQRKIAAGLSAGTKIEGRGQGIAMLFGKGRVVVFGEADHRKGGHCDIVSTHSLIPRTLGAELWATPSLWADRGHTDTSVILRSKGVSN